MPAMNYIVLLAALTSAVLASKDLPTGENLLDDLLSSDTIETNDLAIDADASTGYGSHLGCPEVAVHGLRGEGHGRHRSYHTYNMDRNRFNCGNAITCGSGCYCQRRDTRSFRGDGYRCVNFIPTGLHGSTGCRWVSRGHGYCDPDARMPASPGQTSANSLTQVRNAAQCKALCASVTGCRFSAYQQYINQGRHRNINAPNGDGFCWMTPTCNRITGDSRMETWALVCPTPSPTARPTSAPTALPIPPPTARPTSSPTRTAVLPGWCRQWQHMNTRESMRIHGTRTYFTGRTVTQAGCIARCNASPRCHQAVFEAAGPWGPQCWLGNRRSTARPSGSRRCRAPAGRPQVACQDFCYNKEGWESAQPTAARARYFLGRTTQTHPRSARVNTCQGHSDITQAQCLRAVRQAGRRAGALYVGRYTFMAPGCNYHPHGVHWNTYNGAHGFGDNAAYRPVCYGPNE